MMNTSRCTLAGMLALVALMGGCSEQPAAVVSSSDVAQSEIPETPVAVPPIGQTDVALHEANAAAIWVNARNPDASRIYGSGGTAGVEIYALDGRRLAQVQTSGELKALAVMPSREGDHNQQSLLFGLDVQAPSVVVFAIDGETGMLQPESLSGLEIDGPYEGLCGYQSAIDGENYLFLLGASGRIEQWWLQVQASAGIRARHVRDLNLASESAFCVADSASHSLYVSEKEIGIWRFNADVETEVVPEIIDIVKFGAIAGEVGGLAVYRDAAGAALLLASNASEDMIHMYDINSNHRQVAAVVLADDADFGLVNEPGGLAVTSADLGSGLEAGLLVAMDDDNGDANSNYKLVRWQDVASQLELAGKVVLDPAPSARSGFARVRPTLATEPVATPGDAADDPAIWVHPENPARSTIIGTNKQGGLYVYDLNGTVIQYLEDGQINNVDVRYNFTLGGRVVDLVTASNRSDHSIVIYAVDADTGMLADVADGVQPTAMPDSYGMCMYQQPETRDTWVFVNDTSGLYRQWQLLDAGNGRVRTELVREFSVPSQPEGCVADDEFGVLYVGEEDAALWKFSAAPDGAAEGEIIVAIDGNPALKDDVEGVSLYYGRDGSGYILVSSQGNDSYAVFDRGGNHDYLGSFSIVANAELNLDGASETDGLDVISTPLGQRFPSGIVVVQDGRNLMPAANQNYKVVPWDAVAESLNLQIYLEWDPRQAILRH
jgi:3-phytase